MLDISFTQSVNVIFTGVIDLFGAAGGIVEFKASHLMDSLLLLWPTWAMKINHRLHLQ